jgi:hypothetical protein
MIALLAAAIISAAGAMPAPTDSVRNPADVAPSPTDNAPSPTGSIELDGTVVSVTHLQDLFNAFQRAKTSERIVINVVGKPTSAMPRGALWHYAGSKSAATHVDSWVWLDNGAPHATAAEQRTIAAGIAAGMLLAIMDSGFAGAFWKQFYDAEAAKDAIEASAGGDPFGHRDAVAQRMGDAMVH